MKWSLCLLVLLVSLLSGCASQETFETVEDAWAVPAMAQPREISVQLPDNLVAPVLQQDSCRLYMGRDYEIMLETMASGDISATIQTLSGYEKEQLTVLQTRQEATDRYEFVWTTAGEQGDRLGRAVILDDGNYHYCMSVLRDPGDTPIVWKEVFGSFSLA